MSVLCQSRTTSGRWALGEIRYHGSWMWMEVMVVTSTEPVLSWLNPLSLGDATLGQTSMNIRWISIQCQADTRLFWHRRGLRTVRFGASLWSQTHLSGRVIHGSCLILRITCSLRTWCAASLQRTLRGLPAACVSPSTHYSPVGADSVGAPRCRHSASSPPGTSGVIRSLTAPRPTYPTACVRSRQVPNGAQ